MAKNISKTNLTVNSSVVNSSDILAINRNASVFSGFPTLSVELESLTKIYMSVGQRIESIHKELRIAEAIEAQKHGMNAFAEKAWNAYHNTEMVVPYLQQTRMQATNINTAMLTQTDSMPDRAVLTVTHKQKTDRPRLSVQSKNENNHLVISTILENDGISFRSLPEAIQSQFDNNTRDMYNKLCPFYHTMRKGTGNGKFALLRRTFGNNLNDQVLNQLKSIEGINIEGQKLTSDASSIRYMSLAVNNF